MNKLLAVLVSALVCSTVFGEDITGHRPEVVAPPPTTDTIAQHKTQVWQRYDDNLIYQRVLEQVVKHDKPKQFAIWNRVITSNVFTSERVPRHIPGYQFSRNVPGVTPGLELSLLYKSTNARGLSGEPYNSQLFPFTTEKVEHQFIGFLDASELQRIEDSRAPDSHVLVIGFSRVGYHQEHKQLHALVYVEVGMLAIDGGYGGEGFLLVKQNNEWNVNSHAYLFEGASTPFWRW